MANSSYAMGFTSKVYLYSPAIYAGFKFPDFVTYDGGMSALVAGAYKIGEDIYLKFSSSTDLLLKIT